MAFKCFFFCMWTCVWRWICRYLLYIFMKYSIVFFYSGVAWRVFFLWVFTRFCNNPNTLLICFISVMFKSIWTVHQLISLHLHKPFYSKSTVYTLPVKFEHLLLEKFSSFWLFSTLIIIGVRIIMTIWNNTYGSVDWMRKVLNKWRLFSILHS